MAAVLLCSTRIISELGSYKLRDWLQSAAIEGWAGGANMHALEGPVP